MLAFALIYFQKWLILKSCKSPGWVNEEWQEEVQQKLQELLVNLCSLSDHLNQPPLLLPAKLYLSCNSESCQQRDAKLLCLGYQNGSIALSNIHVENSKVLVQAQFGKNAGSDILDSPKAEENNNIYAIQYTLLPPLKGAWSLWEHCYSHTGTMALGHLEDD